jgi:signal transduction histidine kinase
LLVVFLAYYADGGVPPEPARAEQFEGVVLGIYQLDGTPDDPGMMTDVLGPEPEVNLEIFDSGPANAPSLIAPDDANLLYDSDDELDGVDPGSAPRPNRQVTLDVLNRRWTIFYTPGPGFSSGSSFLPFILGLSGILVTGLLGALVVALARSRRRAADLAEQMTESLVGRERELSQANANMVRSNTDLERYATIAAHDLQEPLRSILAYADLLQRKHGEEMTDEVSDYVVRMSQAAQRMRTLVTDLLAYARLEQKERRDERVDLSDCVRAALGDLNFLIEDAGATIEVDRLPMVYGSSRELIGVFSNLLSNALKYRSPERTPLVRISAERKGNEWVIAIADNGLGIAPDYHMRIFELFRRLGPRDDNSGTGLGLAICARTVAQHGGRIWVESEEGQGSTFWFTLPVKKDERAGSRAAARA